MSHPADCPKCGGSGQVSYEEPVYGGTVTESCHWEMSDAEAFKELCDAIGANGFTFSKHCRSGYVGKWLERCECGRCREGRGEERTAESESQAAADAKRCDELSTREIREILRGTA